MATMGMYADLWGEMARLQRELDHLFRPATGQGLRAMSRQAFPVINVGSTPQALEVLALVPGVPPDQLQVTVDKGVLVILGERRSESPEPGEGLTVYAQERYRGSFKRVIPLPEDVDTQRVEASCRDGLLRIRLPRQEAAQPRRIPIH